MRAAQKILLILSATLLIGCARPGTPDGGPYDETPPQVVGASPAEGATGATPKTIEIIFNEYIKLENASDKIVVSPPQLNQPEISANGHSIKIKLIDTLKANTTYTIDFGDAIVDNNEGNPMGKYTYTFSTGDSINQMEVSGKVLNARNLEPVKGILVGLHSDTIRTRALLIEHKIGTAWTKGGPAYLMPVIELKGHPAEGQTSMPAGKYVIAELEALHGSVDDIIVEGLETVKKRLYVEDGQLVLEIVGLRDAATVTWTGTNGSAWDEAETDNFVLNGESTPFVAGDHVVFNDEAQSKTVSINDNVYPASVTVDNTATYTFKGSGSIGGNAVFTKQNTGGAFNWRRMMKFTEE